MRVKCGDCRGWGETYRAAGHAHGSEELDGPFPCLTCDGTGTVPLSRADWDRMLRDLEESIEASHALRRDVGALLERLKK